MNHPDFTPEELRELAPGGLDKINWVYDYMPLLRQIEDEFSKTKPLSGMRVAMSIHLEAKTARLALLLAAAGAEVHATGCNPLSTQDDIAAALISRGIQVRARHGVGEKEYKEHLLATLSCRPHLLIDDGGDFMALLHQDYGELGENLIGGCEETTTGIRRLLAREEDGSLRWPMMAVNDGQCKHLFDNRYGTGQSTLTAIMAVTNLSIAGRVAVIAGYGWCGRGVAMRAAGMGARVIVTEIDPVKAMEAVMDGYQVMTMEEAAPLGDLFITLTGCKDVITRKHLELMKDGALLSNSGHFDVEINKHDLEALAVEIWQRKPDITGYKLADGRVLNLLAEGRLVNLAAGMGHPAEIMDLSFALQAECLAYLAKNPDLPCRLHPVPQEIDQTIARRKLASLQVKVDTLTPEQEEYYYKGGEL